VLPDEKRNHSREPLTAENRLRKRLRQVPASLCQPPLRNQLQKVVLPAT
jgi:hypothetical protein